MPDMAIAGLDAPAVSLSIQAASGQLNRPNVQLGDPLFCCIRTIMYRTFISHLALANEPLVNQRVVWRFYL
jgi:hypothetical protein